MSFCLSSLVACCSLSNSCLCSCTFLSMSCSEGHKTTRWSQQSNISTAQNNFLWWRAGSRHDIARCTLYEYVTYTSAAIIRKFHVCSLIQIHIPYINFTCSGQEPGPRGAIPSLNVYTLTHAQTYAHHAYIDYFHKPNHTRLQHAHVPPQPQRLLAVKDLPSHMYIYMYT